MTVHPPPGMSKNNAARGQEETWRLPRRLLHDDEEKDRGDVADARRIGERRGLSATGPYHHHHHHPPSSTSRPTKRPRIEDKSARETTHGFLPAVDDAVCAAAMAPTVSSAPVFPKDASRGVSGEGASLLVDDNSNNHHPGLEATVAANVRTVPASLPDADDFLFHGKHPALITPEPSTVDLHSYQKYTPSQSSSSSLSTLTGYTGHAKESSSCTTKPSASTVTASSAMPPLSPKRSSGTMQLSCASSTRKTRHVSSSLALCCFGFLVSVCLMVVRLDGLPRPLGAAIRDCRNFATTMVELYSVRPTRSSWNDPASALAARNDNVDQIETVYVPGGGFSGFWYTLGRLRSIRNPWHRKEYYCFSAGCLGVVATLLNQSMDDLYAQASHVQAQWQVGSISRYDVVGHFVDSLLSALDDDQEPDVASTFVPTLYDSSETNATLLNRLLPRLRIITSVPNPWGFLVPSIRTPSNRQELKQMLVQTTWIPFATGYGLWYDQHMDGAFTLVQHPKCDYDVGLSLDADLYSNVVNVNLPWSKVEKFWNAGLAHGL